MVLGGEAGNIDSLVVLSNIPWQLKGPEWIEAWDGNHWVSLSPTRSMINSGMGNIGEEQTVRLRTAGDNQSDANLTGYFSITPLYDSDVEVELDVIQLGKYNVAPDRILVMCHSAAATWKTGIGGISIMSVLLIKNSRTLTFLMRQFFRGMSIHVIIC